MECCRQNPLCKYQVEKGIASEPVLDELIKAEVGDVNGKALVHLLCHIGTDTLSWRLLGAQITGVDISPESIKYAQRIANQSGLEATFITADVMELMDQVKTTYDIVFASTGVLSWIPNIERFAVTVRQLLKPGGFFYLHDGHPFRDNILGETENGETIIKNDYFYTGFREYESFTDYTVKDLEIPAKSYEWSWTLGDVVTAFCQAGMRIAFLHEFSQNFYYGYEDERNKRELYPCTFSLKAIVE
jgi:SAM-dependent methyltransferase